MKINNYMYKLKNIFILLLWLFSFNAFTQTNYSINTGMIWDNEFIPSFGATYIRNNLEYSFVYVFPKKDTYFYENYIQISDRQFIENQKLKYLSYRFSITHTDLVPNLFFDDKSTLIGTIGYSINSYQRATSYGETTIGNMMFLMSGVKYKNKRTHFQLLVGVDIGKEFRFAADIRIGFNLLKYESTDFK